MVACSLSKDDSEADPTEARYLVKWTSLAYNECTWETRADLDDDALISTFWQRQEVPPKVSLVYSGIPISLSSVGLVKCYILNIL